MLDGLLNRGFSSKCKSLIKANRARIEVVRRRAEAKKRFLKEDLAKLLSNGLDINAYGRTEEYIAGMNLLSCYGFIELSCEYIVKQLSRMQKQGECPEECRQAVASLMFAAARFSDLPELRELRDIFQERYGSNLEVFVNQKFVENLSSKPPATANKLRVLEDIASEFSMNWDSRSFEQRMAAPSVVAKVDIQKAEIVTQRPGLLDEKNRKHGYGEGNVFRRDEINYDIAGRQEAAIVYKEKPLLKRGESSSSQRDDDILFRGSHFQTGNNHSSFREKGARDNAERLSSSFHGKTLENVHAGYTGHTNGIYNPRKVEGTEALICQKAEVAPNFAGHRGKTEKPNYSDHSDALNSVRKEPAGGSDRLKGSSNYPLPPPYVKSKDNIALPPYIKPKEDKGKVSRGSKHADENEHPIDPSSFKSKSVNSSGGPRDEQDAGRNEEHFVASENNADLLKPRSNYSLRPPYVKSKDKIALPPYSNPKDITSRGSGVSGHSVDSSSHKGNGVNNSFSPPNELDHPDPAKVKTYGREKELVHEGENIPLPRPRSMRRKHHKSSSSGYDIEGSSADVGTARRSSSSRRRDPSRKEEHHRKDDEERIIDKLLIHYSKKPSSYDEEKLRKKFPGQQSDGGEHEAVTRSVSLPHEATALPESKRVLTRMNTFQPDNPAPHVHPKLPDYDDLAARFNALRGR